MSITSFVKFPTTTVGTACLASNSALAAFSRTLASFVWAAVSSRAMRRGMLSSVRCMFCNSSRIAARRNMDCRASSIFPSFPVIIPSIPVALRNPYPRETICFPISTKLDTGGWFTVSPSVSSRLPGGNSGRVSTVRQCPAFQGRAKWFSRCGPWPPRWRTFGD